MLKFTAAIGLEPSASAGYCSNEGTALTGCEGSGGAAFVSGAEAQIIPQISKAKRPRRVLLKLCSF